MSDPKKPTIAELEAILQNPSKGQIVTLPNGEIRAINLAPRPLPALELTVETNLQDDSQEESAGKVSPSIEKELCSQCGKWRPRASGAKFSGNWWCGPCAADPEEWPSREAYEEYCRANNTTPKPELDPNAVADRAQAPILEAERRPPQSRPNLCPEHGRSYLICNCDLSPGMRGIATMLDRMIAAERAKKGELAPLEAESTWLSSANEAVAKVRNKLDEAAILLKNVVSYREDGDIRGLHVEHATNLLEEALCSMENLALQLLKGGAQ